MKAVVQERYGSPDGLRLREVDKPTIAEDQLLVKVHAASLNASDWHLLRRLPHVIARIFFGRRPSRIRGSDMAGIVEAVGKSVTRFKPGDEIFGSAIGTFAEYAAAPENRVAPKPRNLTFEQAATISGAGCTALQGLRDKAHVQPGQRVVIYGAGGGVGTFAVQIAKALGAHVTAVTSTENLELLRSIGADEVIDYTRDDFIARGQRYDVVFDIGADRTGEEYRRVLAPNGRLLLVGAPAGMGKMLLRTLKALFPRKQGRKISYIARINPDDLLTLKELAEAEKLVPVIDRRYPLGEVPDALRYFGTRRVRGKVVIVVA